MSIGDRIGVVRGLLDRIIAYDHMVASDSFTPDTITDMKGNAKDICDAVKSETDNIKIEIDQWG